MHEVTIVLGQLILRTSTWLTWLKLKRLAHALSVTIVNSIRASVIFSFFLPALQDSEYKLAKLTSQVRKSYKYPPWVLVVLVLLYLCAMSASLAPECNDVKEYIPYSDARSRFEWLTIRRQYDSCFLKWYSESRWPGDALTG